MDAVIVIDSNVWIFAETSTADEHAAATQAIERVLTTDTYSVNPIILSEVFHALARLLGEKEAARRTAIVVDHPSGEWFSFSSLSAKSAVALAADSQLRINDALIAQHALELEAPVLTDNLKDFRKVRGLMVMTLRANMGGKRP